jgi:hypothetical protein
MVFETHQMSPVPILLSSGNELRKPYARLILLCQVTVRRCFRCRNHGPKIVLCCARRSILVYEDCGIRSQRRSATSLEACIFSVASARIHSASSAIKNHCEAGKIEAYGMPVPYTPGIQMQLSQRALSNTR